MAASSDFLAAPWEAGGGGILGVMHIKDCVRHTSSIQDVAFSPFYASMVATASDDTTVRVWDIPPELDESPELKDSIAILSSHVKKVLFVGWNPIVDFVLATGSFDATVKLWDTNQRSPVENIKLDDVATAMQWNQNGNLLGVVTKGKQLLAFDPRTSTPGISVPCHEGSKAIKLTWLDGYAGCLDHILTTGFSKNQFREAKVWDTRQMNQPTLTLELDRASQPLYPVYDECTGSVYLAGKGDGNTRCFQFYQGALNKTGEYKSNVPIKSFTFATKVSCDTSRCEIGRMLKCENGKSIIPISFVIPRKNVSVFQEDLFPPIPVLEPSLETEEWLAGEDVTEIKRLPHLEVVSDAKRTQIIPSKLKRGTTTVTESRAVLRKKTVKINDSVDKLQLSLEDAIDKIAALEEENEELRAQLKDIKKSSNPGHGNQQQVINGLKKEINELHSSLEQRKSSASQNAQVLFGIGGYASKKAFTVMIYAPNKMKWGRPDAAPVQRIPAIP
ncbi:putative coronin [Cardiosporidium cionae]|uniref:Coronin n=1 Tax=Cardiosporidium cionae TaxID=476202 RepID=A0ABQ7J5P2_9APIC|nr:putative coronin [Cardiosporidium cionae]|eukprot:KAF8819319.1 putative coronin [Cardiosporidium cionae]